MGASLEKVLNSLCKLGKNLERFFSSLRLTVYLPILKAAIKNYDIPARTVLMLNVIDAAGMYKIYEYMYT